MRDGRLAGVEIPAAPGGDYLGDDASETSGPRPRRSAALVFVHPSTRGFALAGAGGALPVEHGRQPGRDDGDRGAHGRSGGARRPSESARPARARRRRAAGAARPARARADDPSDPAATSGRDRAASTSTPSCTTSRCCAGSSSSSAPIACCSAPTIPFDMGVERPAEIVRALALAAGRRGEDPRRERAAAAGSGKPGVRRASRASARSAAGPSTKPIAHPSSTSSGSENSACSALPERVVGEVGVPRDRLRPAQRQLLPRR